METKKVEENDEANQMQNQEEVNWKDEENRRSEKEEVKEEICNEVKMKASDEAKEDRVGEE